MCLNSFLMRYTILRAQRPREEEEAPEQRGQQWWTVAVYAMYDVRLTVHVQHRASTLQDRPQRVRCMTFGH
ncbi:hypothetical protein HYFRA_00008159 [Hymenoscyphus fraxineus]|uniref:Uncharacterized protein n=1 Tax=Hymenoscyphus fraxineus TaxID=746836 RepID=A0A9N9PYJ6_9HELO|nr:hypothetical protein HYFRA_00008159 [Hymenoscyphus fraxineus]